MTAEIISIGDELLIGQVVNTNSAWIAPRLNNIGVTIRQVTTIGDRKEEILRAMKEATQRADLILLTGGLGPTKDDITKAVLCEFFQTKLVLNEETLQDIRNIFSFHKIPMPEINIKQAEIPENCIPLRNKYGTAPGMRFEFDGKFLVSLPGVPYEMKALMEEQVIPRLKTSAQSNFIIHRTVKTYGIGESSLMELITDWEERLEKDNIRLAYLPSPGKVRLRLSAEGSDEKYLNDKINDYINELTTLIPTYFRGDDTVSLEGLIGNQLRKNKQTLCASESCTGGFISHLITSVSGSSDYFKGSLVAYSNEIKTDFLGVSKETLVQHGAVSKETVELMAVGLLDKFHTHYSIATSGIAGPTGGTPDKPVGTVWIALGRQIKPNDTIETDARIFHFSGDRDAVIRKTAEAALNMLWEGMK